MNAMANNLPIGKDFVNFVSPFKKLMVFLWTQTNKSIKQHYKSIKENG